jgi:hypothetical protein
VTNMVLFENCPSTDDACWLDKSQSADYYTKETEATVSSQFNVSYTSKSFEAVKAQRFMAIFLFLLTCIWVACAQASTTGTEAKTPGAITKADLKNFKRITYELSANIPVGKSLGMEQPPILQKSKVQVTRTKEELKTDSSITSTFGEDSTSVQSQVTSRCGLIVISERLRFERVIVTTTMFGIKTRGTFKSRSQSEVKDIILEPADIDLCALKPAANFTIQLTRKLNRFSPLLLGGEEEKVTELNGRLSCIVGQEIPAARLHSQIEGNYLPVECLASAVGEVDTVTLMFAYLVEYGISISLAGISSRQKAGPPTFTFTSFEVEP